MVQLLPAMLAAAHGAVFNGVPPYDLWEHPPALGKIPPHRSDAGSYLVAEVFGARSMIFIKDVDGLYTADPKTNNGAEFIRNISVADLLALRLSTLPFDPIVLDLMRRARLAKRIRIIKELTPRDFTPAFNGGDMAPII